MTHARNSRGVSITHNTRYSLPTLTYVYAQAAQIHTRKRRKKVGYKMLKQTHAHRHRHTHTHTVGEVTMFQLRSTDYTKTHNKVKYVCIGIQINARIHSKKT